MNIYVGNLDYKLDEAQIEDAFAEFGSVESVKIITDRETGRSKGFAFVVMNEDAEAKAAIAKLNGTKLGSRDLVVNEARPKTERA